MTVNFFDPPADSVNNDFLQQTGMSLGSNKLRNELSRAENRIDEAFRSLQERKYLEAIDHCESIEPYNRILPYGSKLKSIYAFALSNYKLGKYRETSLACDRALAIEVPTNSSSVSQRMFFRAFRPKCEKLKTASTELLINGSNSASYTEEVERDVCEVLGIKKGAPLPPKTSLTASDGETLDAMDKLPLDLFIRALYLKALSHHKAGNSSEVENIVFRVMRITMQLILEEDPVVSNEQFMTYQTKMIKLTESE